MPTLSVLVPCLNEEENIESTVMTLIAALEGLINDYEVLIVDDASTDRTGEIADELASRFPRVKTIHHSRNLGLGGSFHEGAAQATKDYVMTVFGDNEIDPRSLRALFLNVGKADLIIPFLANVRLPPPPPLSSRILFAATILPFAIAISLW